MMKRRTFSYSTRLQEESLIIDEDVEAISSVHIEIPADLTLTIEEGYTVTVIGGISVYGKLINNGTIIVGDEKSDKKDGFNTGKVYNFGNFINSGSIKIVRGELSNEGTGKMENKGTITISNKEDDFKGLSNWSISTSDGLKYGNIINTGTINVQNSGGGGIINSENAKFENKVKYLGLKKLL